MATYERIKSCRISGSTELELILSLGEQSLTGVFPRSVSEAVSKGPLDLLWAPQSGLVQLGHSFDSGEMYGDNYGYRSALNPRMVDHLRRKAKWIENKFPLREGSLVIDIGSNDGTLLNSYSTEGIERVGFDPVANKYRENYEKGIRVVDEFFSSGVLSAVTSRPVDVITSIAMFYDLENPVEFVADIATSLSPQGIWHFEQSYLPSMLRTTSYDTICHEHYEYYSLTVVSRLLESQGLKILDVQTNSVNGGSFAVTASLAEADYVPNKPLISWLLEQEVQMGLDDYGPYKLFAERVLAHRAELVSLVNSLVDDGKIIAGYGASTKGNVLLQYCDFGPDQISFIADVNPEKAGRFTPGTHIPIIPEEDARAQKPDYFLVLPWHFRDFIIEKEGDFLDGGGKLLFPLPEIEIVG